MAISIQQDDYNILKQNIIPKYIKLDILDFTLNTLDEVSGDLISMSVSVDANSDLRRTCQVSLVVTDNRYAVQSGGRIWLDKYVHPWVGYKNIHSDRIQWYNQGVFLINAPSYQYDVTTNTLSFEALDLMSQLTGLRNGQIEGLEVLIPQGSNVRDSIISTLSQLGNFNRYIVSNCEYDNGTIQNVPNDIQINQGGTVFDILKELRDILPSYEIFFNTDGVFIYQQIPTGQHEPILLSDDILQTITTDEKVDVDFEQVKNIVEVWGYTHDLDYVATSASIDGNNITLEVPVIETLSENVPIGFKLDENVSGNINIAISGSQKANTYTVKDVTGQTYGDLLYGGGFTKTGDADAYRWVPTQPQSVRYYMCRIYFNFDSSTSVVFNLMYKNQIGTKMFGVGKIDTSFESGVDLSNCETYSGIPISDTIVNSGVGTIVIPSGVHFIDVFLTMNTYTDGDYYGFIVNSIPYSNGVDTNFYPLTIQSGATSIDLQKDTLYLISWNGTNWTFLGHQQAQAVAKDTNPNSPFQVTENNSLYNIRLVLYGGEYDNIYTDDLAQQRADYELWKRTRLEDTVILSCVPIPWLDVNQVVAYTPHNSDETHRYIVKSISTDYGDDGSQTITMIRYYPLYPNI